MGQLLPFQPRGTTLPCLLCSSPGAGKLQQSFIRLHWDIAHAFVCILPRAAFMQQWQRWAAETETTRPTMSHGNT